MTTDGKKGEDTYKRWPGNNTSETEWEKTKPTDGTYLHTTPIQTLLTVNN